MKPKWMTHAAAGCTDPAFGPGWGYPWDGPAGSLQEPRVGGPRVLGRWLDRRLGNGLDQPWDRCSGQWWFDLVVVMVWWTARANRGEPVANSCVHLVQDFK